MRRPALALAVLALAGCSSGGDGSPDRRVATAAPETATPMPAPAPVDRGPASRADIAVIRGWAGALRGGDVERAADYFALPARVSNGEPPFELRTRAAVRYFNQSLTCGARLVSTVRQPRGFVLATFRLTERPGAGRCGDGTGARARTLFDIRGGRIVQWLRAADPPPGDRS